MLSFQNTKYQRNIKNQKDVTKNQNEYLKKITYKGAKKRYKKIEI